jgi:hypothetical protein
LGCRRRARKGKRCRLRLRRASFRSFFRALSYFLSELAAGVDAAAAAGAGALSFEELPESEVELDVVLFESPVDLGFALP